MTKWIRTRLKWLIAGDEMAEVERWRVRCSEYDRWLAAYPDIALVLQNLRGVAQGRLESMGIELNVPWPTDAPGPWGVNALRVKVARMRDGIGESRREPPPSAQGPAELWLQLHGDTQETGLPVDYTGDDVTWCWHQINDSDVRYVRADLAGITPQAGKESGDAS